MRDRLMLEYPEKMCEYCCNFDKEHIGMDGTALCKLTMTLAYSEEYGGNCMFYNVPKEQIIVPPCKVGQTLYVISQMKDKRILPFVNEYEATFINLGKRKCKVYHEKDGFIKIFLQDDFGKTVFLTKELAEKALAERSGK